MSISPVSLRLHRFTFFLMCFRKISFLYMVKTFKGQSGNAPWVIGFLLRSYSWPTKAQNFSLESKCFDRRKLLTAPHADLFFWIIKPMLPNMFYPNFVGYIVCNRYGRDQSGRPPRSWSRFFKKSRRPPRSRSRPDSTQFLSRYYPPRDILPISGL